MKYEEPHYEVSCHGGIKAIVDWVAGGNFDGHVYKKNLTFTREGQRVLLRTEILDQSRHDGVVQPNGLWGKFSFTDHETITCLIGDMTMRGYEPEG